MFLEKENLLKCVLLLPVRLLLPVLVNHEIKWLCGGDCLSGMINI